MVSRIVQNLVVMGVGIVVVMSLNPVGRISIMIMVSAIVVLLRILILFHGQSTITGTLIGFGIMRSVDFCRLIIRHNRSDGSFIVPGSITLFLALVWLYSGLPGLSLPGLSLPGLSLPGLSLFGLCLPGLSLPGLRLPGLGLPGLSLHDLSLPDLSLPGLSLFGLSLFGLRLPGLSLPGLGLICFSSFYCSRAFLIFPYPCTS